MKTIQSTMSLGLALTLFFACSDPAMDSLEKKSGAPEGRNATQQSGCTITLLGDKDGFGRDFKQGDPLYLPGGTSLPLDWRKNDPPFTDVYPADIGSDGYTTHVVQFTMKFPVPTNIERATFHFNTLGIQDGDTQVYNSGTDIKLFIDGQEVKQAFDNIDQFDMFNGQWADFASSFDINIPAHLLYLLTDGQINIRWEIAQTVAGSPSSDAFAIDYCELTVCSPGEDH